MQQSGIDALLGFQIQKEVTALYKRQLEELENIRAEHLIAVQRIKQIIPSDYHKIIDAVSFLDDNTYRLKRKRILDGGNEALRAIESQMSKFNITLK